MPDDYPSRAYLLQNLGAIYHTRYKSIGEIVDLEIAIQQYQGALDITLDDHPDRARRLQDIGAGYEDTYLRTGAVKNLEIAIQRFQKALE